MPTTDSPPGRWSTWHSESGRNRMGGPAERPGTPPEGGRAGPARADLLDVVHELGGVRLVQVDARLLVLDVGGELAEDLQHVPGAVGVHLPVAVEHAHGVLDGLDVQVLAALAEVGGHL